MMYNMNPKIELSIGRDCYAIVETRPSKQLILVNPKELYESENEDTLTKKLLSTFSKFEIENWVAKTMLSASQEAIAKGTTTADFSELVSSSFEVYNYRTDSIDWQIPNERFREKFVSLPFFEKISDGKLKYVVV